MQRPRLLTAVALLGLAGLAFAQATTSGEVRKIDAAGGKITLNHGEVKSLDMPPMNNMVYKVRDPSVLATLKPGDKVEFTAAKEGGAYTLTSIRKP